MTDRRTLECPDLWDQCPHITHREPVPKALAPHQRRLVNDTIHLPAVNQLSREISAPALVMVVNPESAPCTEPVRLLYSGFQMGQKKNLTLSRALVSP